MRRSVLAACAFGMIHCGSPLPFEPAGPDAAPDPSSFGPYPVGVQTFEWSDPSRRVGDHARRVITEVWYPATEDARGQAGFRYPIIDLIHPAVRSQFDPAELGDIPSDAVRDADPIDEPGSLPLVLFSHGNGAMRIQSTFFTVYLASHGYVVAAPDHEGNTLANYSTLSRLDFTDVLTSYLDRPKDLAVVIESLEGLARKDDPVASLIDFDRIGASGHSLGAATAVRSSGLDTRLKAVVAHAVPGHLLTWRETDRELEDVGIPIFLAAGGKDETLPPEMNSDTVYAHVRKPGWQLTIASAGHFTFSDLCLLSSGAIAKADEYGIGNVLEDGCGPENLAPAAALPLIRSYSIGFFNTFLRASEGSRAYFSAEAGERFVQPEEIELESR